MTYAYPFRQCANESDAEYLLRCATWDRLTDILYERARQTLLASAEPKRPIELAKQRRKRRKPKKAAA